MSNELAHAYVSLSVSTGGMKKDVNAALKGIEADSGKTGKSMGEKIGSTLSGALKKTAVGTGVAAGALLATGLTKGVGRLNAIENAESKLLGLGNSARTVEGVMSNALTSVKGTAHGLDEAATTAAMVVASGIEPGQRLESVLKTVGDTASITGASMADMGLIFGSVAARGKLQGDDMMQLMSRGVPVLQMLSKETGIATEEVSKMVSDGKISFDIFASAMEEGVGGAALEMGKTTTGAFKNTGAALGRLGAVIAGPFYDQAAGTFTAITGLLDDATDAAGPWADRLDRALTMQIIPGLTQLKDDALEAFGAFRNSDLARDSVSRLEGIFGSLMGTAKDLGPAVGTIATSLGQASAALGVSGWQLFLTTLEAAGGVASALVPPIELIGDIMEAHPGLVTAAAAAWLAFKTVPGIMSGVSKATAPLIAGTTKLKTAASGLPGSFREFGSAVRESYRYAGQANPQMGRFGQSMTILGANAREAGRSIGSGIKSGVGTAVNALGGPLNIALAGVGIAAAAGVAHSQKLSNAYDQADAASKKLADSSRDLWAALVAGEGATDVAIDQVGHLFDKIDAQASASVGGFWDDTMGRVGYAAQGLAKDIESIFTFSPSKSTRWREEQQEIQWLADEAERARTRFEDLGLTQEDIGRAVSGTAGQYRDFTNVLRNGSEEGEAAASYIQGLRDEFERIEEAQRIATPGAIELSDAFGVLADKSSTAGDRVNALRSGMEALGLIQTSAEQKAFDLAESADKLVESLSKVSTAADEQGNAFFTAEGKLNPLNAGTRELNSRMLDLGDQFLKNVEATGSATEAWESISPELEKVRTSLNLTEDEFEALSRSYGLVPDVAETLVQVKGADEATQVIATASELLSNLAPDEPHEVKIRAESDEAIKALRDAGYEVEKIDGVEGMVKVSADSSAFTSAMDAVVERAAETNTLTALPQILADTTIFRLKDEETKASLAELDMTQVDPKIGAVLDDFLHGRDVTLKELEDLDTSEASPEIKALIDELLRQCEIANRTLDETARSRDVMINPYIGAGSLTALQDTLNSITLTAPVVPAHQLSSLPGAADGGRIPALASGGRLPTTGPGTDRTDGILGVSTVNGTPTAAVDAGEWVINRRSSDRYDRELAAINAGVFPKVAGYEDGGRVGSRRTSLLDFVLGRGGHGQSRSLQGAPYVFGGINWGDCSAAMSAIFRFATGLAPFAGRFATGNQGEALKALGAVMGRGPAGTLRVGWVNGGPGGGHTSGTLDDGTNVEMGGGAGGQGKVGGAAAPWNHPQYTHHAYLPNRLMGFGGIEASMNNTTSKSSTRGKAAVDAISNKDDSPKTWGEVAGRAASEVASGYTEDLLGVLGIPNQLPPILQAYNAMQEDQGEGIATDWELSVAAAEVKQLDAAIHARQRLTDEAMRAITGTPLGDPGLGFMSQLDQELLTIEADKLARERAQSRLDELVLARRALGLEDEDDEGVSELALQKAENKVIDREDAIRRAEVALGDARKGDAKGRVNSERVELAEARLEKARRDLDIAKLELDEKKTEGQDDYVLGDGYNRGGSIPGHGGRDTVALAARPGEYLVNARAAEANRALLEYLNAGGNAAQAPAPVGGQQGGDTYYINALDVDDALGKFQRVAAQRAVSGMGVRG